jgi:hypothetical protein
MGPVSWEDSRPIFLTSGLSTRTSGRVHDEKGEGTFSCGPRDRIFEVDGNREMRGRSIDGGRAEGVCIQAAIVDYEGPVLGLWNSGRWLMQVPSRVGDRQVPPRDPLRSRRSSVAQVACASCGRSRVR